MFSETTLKLMSYIDIIFATYIILFALCACIWFKKERWSLEVALFLLSMIVMPLIYIVMFEWDRAGILIFAPQSIMLLLLAFLSLWGLLKKNFVTVPLIGLALLINVLGYAWTRALLSSSCC